MKIRLKLSGPTNWLRARKVLAARYRSANMAEYRCPFLMSRLSGAWAALAICCGGALAAGSAVAPAQAVPAAAIYCTAPGVPVGCVGRPAVRAVTPGVGAPGAGMRPAAGPGAGPNMGGPANRGGMR